MSIELKQITHIIDAQYAAEQAMLAECRNGDYGIETPYVKLNPYLIAPLTALVYFKTPQATTATVRVKGKEEAGDIAFTFPAAEEHFLPVYGMYADTANTV